MLDGKEHKHSYDGITSFTDGHKHDYSGKSNMKPNSPNHVHCIEGKTEMSNGHIHEYKFETSPPYYIQGGHFHYYGSMINLIEKHEHVLQGYVSTYKSK